MLLLIPPAAAQNQAAVDRGRELYKRVGFCFQCHNWDGNGARSLVTTKLDREGLLEVIRCGRPGTNMPRHGKGSWSPEVACYGLTASDIGPDLPRSPQGRYLTEAELSDVVDYILAVYKDKRMTHENCRAWFGERTPEGCGVR
jgi:mono/diheme cytochrome c family protein